MSLPDYLSRPVLIHVCKDKTLSYRTKNEPIFNGVAIPVFSVENEQEAVTLLRLVGRQQYQEHPKIPGRPWLKITLDGALDFKQELDYDDLDSVTDKLKTAYALIQNITHSFTQKDF